MADVFISYKREDRELVQPLVRTLQERGFTVWWDSRIETGENWMACIKRALDAATCIVVLWTPQSVAADGTYISEIVAAEADQGRQRNILLPVRMQKGPRGWPHSIRNEQDLSDWQGNADDASIERLAGRIATLCGSRNAPETSELAAWLKAEEANNADAYRAFAREFPHSRFAKDAEPRAAEIEQRVADIELSISSAQKIVQQFANEVSKPSFTPSIGFASVERENAVAATRDDLFRRLKDGARAVLQAEPGGGKTTTLLDWAREYSSSAHERVGVYIRLKEMADTGADLIPHVASLDPTGHVSSGAWDALARSGMLTLFCDGWNELSDAERETIGSKLAIHARKYPSSGLIVGSRPLAPLPFKGNHLLLLLQKLTYEQVRAIVEARLGEQAAGALAELRQSRELRDLVRTPFFLSAFCQTRRAGTTPSTREGLIRGMISGGELLPQHATTLRQTLRGQHAKYLRALAVAMLEKQHAELSNDDARRIVNRESRTLLAKDLLTEPLPDASAVLETLRDHHCLIEFAAVDPSFGFQHQLISEWYASDEVTRIAQLALHDDDARRALDRDIIDRPEWAEAILFAVERPGENAAGINAIAHLVLRAVGINPSFAAGLIAIAPPEVWREISPAVESFVGEWASTAKHRAIQFILRCGKEEFSELIWAAISAEKNGDVGHALQASNFPHPRVLGPDWKTRCAALSDRGREGLLTMLVSSRTLEGALMALEVARSDESARVQSAVAGILDFYGFGEELADLLKAARPETWEELVRTRNIDGLWEQPWREHAVAAARRVFAKFQPGPQRLDYALRLRGLGEDVRVDFVAEIIEINFKDYHAARELFARVADVDGERLSLALTDKILAGQTLPYGASAFIRPGTAIAQERLLEASRRKARHAYHEVLSPLLDGDSLTTLLSERLAARSEWRTTEGQARNEAGERSGVLQDALEHADKNALAETILNWTPAGALEVADIADLSMRAYRGDVRDERPPLRQELRAKIIERLADWSSVLVKDPAASRYALHSVAEAVATFPSTSLLGPLRSLLSADLAQWRREKEEFNAAIARRERPDPSSGARMSYAYRYAQNMLSLAKGRDADISDRDEAEPPPLVSQEMTDAVIDVLREFLADHEFGADAARAIATLRPDPVIEIGESRPHMSDDLRAVPPRQRFRAEQTKQHAGPVARQLVQVIGDLRTNGSRESVNLAMQLANSAVRMGCGDDLPSITAFVVAHGSAESICDHMMVRLLFGHDVSGEIAAKCLDELDGRRERQRWEYDQSWFKWERLLILMIFGGGPLEAARRLLTYPRRSQQHDERRIIEALALCGHADALSALDLLRDRCVEQRIIDEWYSALDAIGSVEAGDRLLEMLLSPSGQRETYRSRDIGKMVAELAEENGSLRAKILRIANTGDEASLKRIAGIVRHIDDENFLAEFLEIPGEHLELLSRAIAEPLRDLCVEHHPIEGSNGTYDVIPRSVRSLRARLFARANAGDSASPACTRLLQTIDSIREDYGEPAEETRHPDITVGQPWPPAAWRAWDASIRLVQRKH